MLFVIGLWTFLRALFLEPAAVALENLALRHQLLVLQRSITRPRLSRWDRILWVWLSRWWTGWRLTLFIVQPATVLARHRQGFRLYWRWRSTATRVGRPRLNVPIRRLIRRMARENPTWGRRRIRAELALIGHEIAELTVAKYMHRPSACSSSSSSSTTIAANSSISTSPITPRPSGRRASWSRPFPGTRRRGTSSGIETGSTVRTFRVASSGWGSARSASPRARPGRTPSWSG
jgi:hypothetical protein